MSLILILFAGGLIATPALMNQAHAAGPPTLFLSPASRPLAHANTLVTFNVTVSNMPAFAGWDILIKAGDISVLRPVKINILETFGGTFTELSNCVNGAGLGCDSNHGDGGGVLHSAGYSSTNTDSGNATLFKVTFNSTATSGYSFLSLPSPLITDSTGGDVTPAPGNIFGATYGNSANAPVAEFTWSPTEPMVGESVTFNASLSSDPTPGAVITGYNWGGTATTYPITSLIFYIPGNHTVSLVVTDNKGRSSPPTTHLIHVKQAVPGFHMFAYPSSLSIPQGSSGTSLITAQSIGNFTGSVNLTASVVPSGPAAFLNLTSLHLNPGGLNTTILLVRVGPTTTVGNYDLTLFGSSGVFSASTHLLITVTPPQPPDFTISANPLSVNTPAGSSASYSLFLSSINRFSGDVSLVAGFVNASGINPPVLSLTPASVTVSPNGTKTAELLVTTTTSTPAQFYLIFVRATSGSLLHSLILSLQITGPSDIPPVALFTITPLVPIVGQTISFDGSPSFDPDGTVVSWAWSLGDGYFSYGEFVGHAYNRAGNYTVTLTVGDNAGLYASKTMTMFVRPQPNHDVSLVQLSTLTTRVVSTQTVPIQIQLANNGLSNETVSVTAYANGVPVQTLNGIFLRACNPYCFYNYFTIPWDTTGAAPGNYTISARVSLPAGEIDPTPADNSMTDGTVTVFPAPVVTLAPNSGVIGTKVVVRGSGFLLQQQFGYNPSFVYVDFDNMSTGFTFARNGTFTFVFDVPLSQSGTHQVNVFDPYSGAHASATFTVQPSPGGNLAVSVDMGTIYFPGDVATAFVMPTFSGVPVGPQNLQLQVVLFRPDGTNMTLKAQSIGTGLYRVTYTIPRTGLLGTYLVVARAHQNGPFDASSLVSFEVKLPWLSSDSGRLTVGATALAGVVGLVGVAWKKGYLQRKETEKTQPSSRF